MGYTVFGTVLSGVTVFVIGQILLKIFIEPIHEMRKTVANICFTLNNKYAVIANPGVPKDCVMDATSKEFRDLAATLPSHLFLIPFYGFFANGFFGLIRILPERDRVLSAQKLLRGLSNGLHQRRDGIHEQNAKSVDKIFDLFGVEWADENRWPKEEVSSPTSL